ELRPVQRKASKIIAAYEMEVSPRVALLAPAMEFVRRAPELKLRLGIVTSNACEVVSAVLQRHRLAPAFEPILARGDAVLLKPSPDGLLLCCARMDVAPARCIYVGDSATDMQAARAAGMAAIGVGAGMSGVEELIVAGAAMVFDDLGGLLTALERGG